MLWDFNLSLPPPPPHSSFNSKEIYNNFKSRLFALNWIISTMHEMWTERHLTSFPPLDLRFIQIRTKNSSRARRTETSGRLLTFSLSQHNATDEVIGGRYPRTTARLFAPWEFSEYSNECRVRDTVVRFPASLRDFAINLSATHCCVVRFRRIWFSHASRFNKKYLLFKPKKEDNHLPLFSLLR